VVVRWCLPTVADPTAFALQATAAEDLRVTRTTTTSAAAAAEAVTAVTS
jgi:hypothetical protein